MTAAFAYLLAGWLLLTSSVRNQPIADLLRGALSEGGGPGPGERGFTTSILTELAGGGGGGGGDAGTGPRQLSGMETFDGEQVCGWIAAELRKARQRGWRGRAISGYRNRQEQAEACAHTSGPCATPGQSNHQGTEYPGCAVDVSDPAGLARALPSGSPLKWTGKTIGDEPHFSSGLRGV